MGPMVRFIQPYYWTGLMGSARHNFLKNWRAENPSGLIIATLGMGLDGHTAGILPYPESADEFHRLFESEAWVCAYNAGNKNPHKERITATLTFLKMVDVAFAFVSGADKKQKLDEVISASAPPPLKLRRASKATADLRKKQGKAHELPALAWNEIKDVKIFTDIQE